MYVVTRCLDEGNESDVKLAENFLQVTHQKQLDKDKVKKEKVRIQISAFPIIASCRWKLDSRSWQCSKTRPTRQACPTPTRT